MFCGVLWVSPSSLPCCDMGSLIATYGRYCEPQKERRHRKIAHCFPDWSFLRISPCVPVCASVLMVVWIRDAEITLPVSVAT